MVVRTSCWSTGHGPTVRRAPGHRRPRVRLAVPAWKSLPTWYLVAANDEAIPPDAERQFAARMGATTVEVESGHVAMVSHPDDVAALIITAAEAVAADG